MPLQQAGMQTSTFKHPSASITELSRTRRYHSNGTRSVQQRSSGDAGAPQAPCSPSTAALEAVESLEPLVFSRRSAITAPSLIITSVAAMQLSTARPAAASKLGGAVDSAWEVRKFLYCHGASCCLYFGPEHRSASVRSSRLKTQQDISSTSSNSSKPRRPGLQESPNPGT